MNIRRDDYYYCMRCGIGLDEDFNCPNSCGPDCHIRVRARYPQSTTPEQDSEQTALLKEIRDLLKRLFDHLT
jgi:hypothetical protein